MINHHIDNAISLLDYHYNQIELYQDVFEWGEAAKFNTLLNDDETEYNKNADKVDSEDRDFLRNCRRELKYHQYELERAKVRLRICMLTFNNGWIFYQMHSAVSLIS